LGALVSAITVRRIHLDRDGYAKNGPQKGRYFGHDAVGTYFKGAGPLYYCPEIADLRSPLFSDACYARSWDHLTVRAAFKIRLERIAKGESP
jgi:hypothetical protein